MTGLNWTALQLKLINNLNSSSLINNNKLIKLVEAYIIFQFSCEKDDNNNQSCVLKPTIFYTHHINLSCFSLGTPHTGELNHHLIYCWLVCGLQIWLAVLASISVNSWYIFSSLCSRQFDFLFYKFLSFYFAVLLAAPRDVSTLLEVFFELAGVAIFDELPFFLPKVAPFSSLLCSIEVERCLLALILFY